jgi:hypothetical protein
MKIVVTHHNGVKIPGACRMNSEKATSFTAVNLSVNSIPQGSEIDADSSHSPRS